MNGVADAMNCLGLLMEDGRGKVHPPSGFTDSPRSAATWTAAACGSSFLAEFRICTLSAHREEMFSDDCLKTGCPLIIAIQMHS